MIKRILRVFRRKKSNKNKEIEAVSSLPQPADGHELQMSFWEHLDELRIRATRAFIALFIGAIAGFFLAGPVLEFIRGPYCRLVDIQKDCELKVLGPTSGIVAYFRVALLIGASLAIPMITYQVLMFVLPGMTRRERRVVLRSIPAITALFVVGVIFTWYILMPPALGFLEGFQPSIFEPEWTAELYINFVTTLLFWMGVAFETPLVFFVLAFLGLVTAQSLARNWRFAMVGAAIAAAFITPTVDPVNMFLVMGPLMVLYLVSILLVSIGRRMGGHT